MATATETLRAVEARAERAIVPDLLLLIKELAALQARLVLEDLVHADAQLLKLCRPEHDPAVAPAIEHEAASPVRPAAQLGPNMLSRPAFRVCFYNHEPGELTHVVTTHSFGAGLQLVRDRLQKDADYEIDASWIQGLGEMEVRTPLGTTVARVEALSGGKVAAQRRVIAAFSGLQVGDVAPIAQLFDPVPEAA